MCWRSLCSPCCHFSLQGFPSLCPSLAVPVRLSTHKSKAVPQIATCPWIYWEREKERDLFHPPSMWRSHMIQGSTPSLSPFPLMHSLLRGAGAGTGSPTLEFHLHQFLVPLAPPKRPYSMHRKSGLYLTHGGVGAQSHFSGLGRLTTGITEEALTPGWSR